MKDYIKCINCEYEGTVKIGTKKCPKCHKKGCLSWVENMPQEVDDNYIKKERI